MKIKGLIFDLDGVLVFTDKFHYQAWKTMADELGVYFDETINHRLRGVSRMDSLEIILERYEGPDLSLREKEKLAEKKNEIYRTLLESMTPDDVTKEVRDTLTKLREKGYKLAIGSSSKNAKFILEKVELKDAFDAISDGNNITKSKPDPEVFLKAAEYLGLPPKACMVVEDAEAGIEAAKKGGMYAAGIGEAAKSINADESLKTFSELVDIVDK
ncbi:MULTISPECIES: beta-phosphoglucomutase [Lachnospiraceae]|uniref:beta-phosphoglucomutase n=1 Tax=Lachnospiraceae TaxID=186803 RepID=UPI001D07DD44|nr:beta-phosphoglucomutase [Anaerobutyricum hallii]MCB6623458.1 beta-phosphoglucomutase [Mediterraneibacter sp. 210702-DFI.5.30]